MSEHSKGPWTIDDVDRVVNTDGNFIATCSGSYFLSSREIAANARLIAAAPEMLEALKALDKFWTDEFPKGPDVPAPFPNAEVRLGEDTIAIWKQIRAAIAKATRP